MTNTNNYSISNSIAQKMLLTMLGASITLGGYIAKSTINNGREISAISAMIKSFDAGITRHDNNIDELSRKLNDLQQVVRELQRQDNRRPASQ